ncbi:hypothetical protein BHM03_00018427 [Ensete ventricosum]|nr:hypothetical protein BHM03_00018427 [Ensete ventricosum]
MPSALTVAPFHNRFSSQLLATATFLSSAVAPPMHNHRSPAPTIAAGADITANREIANDRSNRSHTIASDWSSRNHATTS